MSWFRTHGAGPVRVRLDVVLDPSAPERTSQIVFEVHEEWAPLGARRFVELVAAGYYDEARVYRVIPGFIAQWGIPRYHWTTLAARCTTRR